MTPHRHDRFLPCITKSMKILEIGPSYNPAITRAEGWNVYSLDHSTADELHTKYTGMTDTTLIQNVDFVWRDGPLETAIPKHELGTFDAVIGSHIIEHIPDLVTFFHSMERILSPTGIVVLAAPDKRFCFDFFQSITMTGEILEAYRTRSTRHKRSVVFNSMAYQVNAGNMGAWSQHPTGQLSFSNPDVRQAGKHALREETDEPYEDSHAWYFTYSSFRLIMLELAWMDLLDFHEVYTSPTDTCEFYVTLGRGEPTLTEEQFCIIRMELMTNILLEVREQTDFLIDGPNYLGAAPALIAG